MFGRGTRSRAVVLIALAAWLVHQGRYVLAFGGDADRTLAAQGHAYLGVVGPVLVWLLAAAFGRLLADLAARQSPSGQLAGFGRMWAAASAALVAIYAGQELAEGWLASGHPGGLAGVLGAGGWLALPLAVVLGALVVALVRGAHAVQSRRAAAAIPRPRLSPRRPARWRPADVVLLRCVVLAWHLAGRAPPRRSAASLS